MSRLLAALALAAATLVALPSWAQAPSPPAVAAAAWTLVDVTSGQTIASQRTDERRDPASLTKLMTAYLVFGALRQKTILPSQMVNVSERAWRAEGSRMFIEPRKSVSVDELLHGMIVQSGNDASIALAELVGGTEAAFVDRMNAEAKRLGMLNTQFTNATGLADPKHWSTARRPREARARGDPRLSRVLPALREARVPLQQDHAAQPQPAAVDRSVRRRHEDRPHRGGRLVPDRLGEARRAAPAVGRARRGVGRGARGREPEAPELRLPGLRHGAALPVGQAGGGAAGCGRARSAR